MALYTKKPKRSVYPKRRVYKKTGYKPKASVSTLKRKVYQLSSTLKPEKKHKTVSAAGLLVGQINVNASAYGAYDITPLCASSTTYGGRSGSRIRLVSSYIQMQLFGQGSTTSNIRGRILVFKTSTPQTSPGTFVANMLNYNSFAGGGFSIVDYNSSYNPDFFRDWKLIREKKFMYRPDNITNQNMILSLAVPLKYNKGKGHVIQYNKDSNTLVDGQILMVILLDNGNVGAVSTLTNVPIIAANTGLNLNYNVEHYYTDV